MNKQDIKQVLNEAFQRGEVFADLRNSGRLLPRARAKISLASFCEWRETKAAELAAMMSPAPQPIESAPRDGTEILAWWVNGHGWTISWWSISGGDMWVSGPPDSEYGYEYEKKYQPTHWLPLPPKPEVA
jgi:hypothetical protein